ncbi:MAG: RNA ligase (ATP) [Candidatus Bathyarchaeia archaeon]
MADIDRKLASVRTIAAIDPIEGADKIVCVTVDGWKLVSGKDNGFQVGDLVIYFEIDSFLPVREEFEWMRDRCYKNVPGLGEGFRVKTIKLRGQVSQGLIVPLSDFLNQDHDNNWYFINQDTGDAQYVDEGSDLTEFLGVRKYEKPIPVNMQGRTKGNFPSFIRKTDEERIQNCWGGIKKWIFNGESEVVEIDSPQDVEGNDGTIVFQSGDKWFMKTIIPNDPDTVAERSKFEATLKLDGSSLTVYHYEGQLGVCSRNLELKRDPENLFWKAALKTGLLGYFAQNGGNLAVQGELMGPGVQGNRENLEEVDMYVFNVFDIDQQRYYTPKERRDWIDSLDIHVKHTPVLDFCLTFDGDEDVDFFLATADAIKSLNHPIAEGIVFKSHLPDGPSFKAISNKFLLKEAD